MSKKGKSGIYITACCLAVVAAVVGFLAERPKNDEDNMVENLPEISEESVEKEPIQEVEKTETEIEESSEDETEIVSKAETIEEVHFIRPVEGKVIEEFSGNNLIYNEGLRDWRTHNGVDMEAESGTQVLASANGVVEAVYDSNMGKCMEIDHQNGYKTLYANLDVDVQLKKGDEVAEGDVIGIVGNTALGDATDIPHLHFEIIKDGENINPVDFLE